jgi:hypothetical protein
MASSAALAANNALISIARIDDHLYPTQQFSLEIELELDVAGITGVLVSVGNSEVALEPSDGYACRRGARSQRPLLRASWEVEASGPQARQAEPDRVRVSLDDLARPEPVSGP